MIVGVDLDNTIVCYDGLFHRIALQRHWIPEDLASDKQAVRDFLHASDRHDEWTMLQGAVYGDEMVLAKPFPGATEFFAKALEQGCKVQIVSHRTRKPYLGPETDLHEAARNWLSRHGFSDTDFAVFLEESLDQKLDRIRKQRCGVFVDDLPELLLHESFPAGVRGICFDPEHRCCEDLECVDSWSELAYRLLKEPLR